jgi:hypothetical protein
MTAALAVGTGFAADPVAVAVAAAVAAAAVVVFQKVQPHHTLPETR